MNDGCTASIWLARAEDRTCCPACGFDFCVPTALNLCGGCGKPSDPDELIREDEFQEPEGR